MGVVDTGFGREQTKKGYEDGLGRDFWLYRIGHFISTLGDSCTTVALSWWVLEQTESVELMSTILLVGMSTRLALQPLLSPLGDRLSRGKLMLSGYGLSAAAVAGYAVLSFLELFILPLVIALSVLTALGSVMFGLGATGALVKLIPANKYQTAVRTWEAVGSIAFIAGGILGGAVVSAAKCKGAFMLDVMSFIIAFLMVWAIKSDTRPAGAPTRAGESLGYRTLAWASDMQEGLVVLWHIRFLLGVLSVLMLMNLAIAPLPVVIPYFIKEIRNLPAWYIGFLDSALGVGIFLGASALSMAQRYFRRDVVALGGLVLVGAGLALFGLPGIATPCTGMLAVGVGSTLFNITLTSNLMQAIPDHFRTRLFAWIVLVCQSARPLGLSLAGIIIERIPVPVFSCAIGATVLAMVPILALSHEFCLFLRMDSKEAEGYFSRRYGVGAEGRAPQ